MLETAPQDWDQSVTVGIRSKTACERDALKTAVDGTIDRMAKDARQAFSLVEDIVAGKENARRPLERKVTDGDLREIMNAYANFLSGKTGPNKEAAGTAIEDWAARKKEQIHKGIDSVARPVEKPAYTGPARTA